ncbi:hypothetical protein ACHAXR_002762, partial [Thalassiosira sp. AJA248-18]
MDPELARIRRERYLAQKIDSEPKLQPAVMSSAAGRAAADGNQKTAHQEVIALLDSDSEDDSGVKGPNSSTTVKSTNNGGKAPFVLYATTTSKTQIRTNDAAKQHFWTLREIIGLDTANKSKRRKFQWLIVFNFLIDFSYLLEKLRPDILKFHRVVVFYGNAGNPEAMDQWKQLLVGTGNTVEFIQLLPSDPPRSRTNPLAIKIPYGVHHTKMFLMGYKENNQSMCRVVVHTANILLGDVEYKSQGAYCQDFPLKQNDNGKMPKVVNPYKRKREGTTDDKSSGWPFEEDDVPFEEDLVTYLESYRYLTHQSWCSTSSTSETTLSNKPMSWLQLIRQYDYSNAYAVLVPSVPGRHKNTDYHNFGYLKLRKAVIDWVCSHRQNSKQPSSPKPIVCQFSSIGSLNEKWLNQFLSAIDYSSTRDVDPIKNDSQKGGKKGPKDNQPPVLSSRMKIVWPTMDEIRTSVEGYQGGG